MKYTYTITSNKKRYPVKYKILVNRIQNECMNIYSYLMDANRLQVITSEIQRVDCVGEDIYYVNNDVKR